MSKVYVIAHSGMFANLRVTSYESRAVAKAAAEGISSIAAEVVEDEGDLGKLGGPALAALYNALTGETVSRFASRNDGARRAFAALDAKYHNQVPEAAAPSQASTDAAETTPKEENDMAAKKTKGPKRVRVTGPKEKKERKAYSTTVKSSGGAESKATALEMISRTKGATPEEIAEKVECSVGTAKNLIWYLRRDGKKIVLGEKAGDRRPYVIG